MDNRDVPFIVFEASMSRMERTIKRLWITIMLLICLLVGSNLAWLYSQFGISWFYLGQKVDVKSIDFLFYKRLLSTRIGTLYREKGLL